jgi:hypothetical protein
MKIAVGLGRKPKPKQVGRKPRVKVFLYDVFNKIEGLF